MKCAELVYLLYMANDGRYYLTRKSIKHYGDYLRNKEEFRA